MKDLMIIEGIIDEAVENEVHLYVEDGKLKYKAKPDALSAQLKKNLREHKSEIVSYLNAEQQRQKSQSSADLKLLRRKPSDPLLLSYAQQRLWFSNQYLGPNAMYNIPLALRLQGEVNIHALIQSLEALVVRHESLRTRFKTHEGIALQVIDPPTLEIAVEPVATEKALYDIRQSERYYKFDLSQDRLCRMRLLQDVSDSSYALLVTMHHSISDAWSLGIFFRELVTLYQAFRLGKPSPLKPLAIQYADYAVWQRKWLTGDVLEEQLAYWRDQLAGLPPLLTLPTDRPRPVEQTYRGSGQLLVLSPELSDRLQSLSEDQGVTLYMTLMSAFALLLSRYSGQDDVAIGSSIANRGRKETDGLIGFLVNTLVMRNNLGGDPRFVELLQKTRKMALQGYAHQDIPFELLVETLRPERSLSQSPLFQVFFILQNATKNEASLSGLEFAPLQFKNDYGRQQQGGSRFDLTLRIKATPEGIRGTMEYSTDLFDRSSIVRMFSHFELLLTAIVSVPDARISNLEFLSEAEKRQQLVEWNDTAKLFPQDQTIHALFEEQVVNDPKALALVYEDQELSYAELNHHSNRLAHYLLSLGVAAESRVGLCVERSLDMVVALLGILKAGGAYVPLDPAYPRDRLEYMLNDSDASIILTQVNLLNQLPVKQQQLICLDNKETQAELAKHKSINTDLSSQFHTNNNLAYVIYTSGSTGRPKGVLVSHRNVCDFLYHAVDNFLADHIVGSVVNSPLAFDATVGSLLVPLCAGKYAELLPDGVFALDRLCDYLGDDEDAFLFKVTPSLLEAVFEKGFMQKNVKARHVIVVAGEPLKQENLNRWRSHFLPASQFINEYGPTETTVGSTIYPVLNPLNNMDNIVPVGRPFGDTSLYVLDENLSLQCVGCIGELCIGGEGVSRGYLNKAGYTAQRFVPNPFSTTQGDRLYRTGDLVRFQADGNIAFVGRFDGQVKIRGFRIELGEIEYQLSRCKGIGSSAVLAREDNQGDKTLVAYVLPEDKESATEYRDSVTETELVGQVKQQLQTLLPDYMVPSAFVILDSWPLTPNGKIDNKALPLPGEAYLQKEAYVAPRNKIEKTLAHLWQELLKVESVGVYDNFFSLGGHSLLATRLVSSIRQEFEVELPLRMLFESPTIAGLSQSLSEKLKTPGDEFVLPPVKPVGRDQVLPLSYAQQRLWFIDQLGEGSVQYNMPGRFLLKEKFNATAFRKTLQSIMVRHEVLRTHFKTVDGEAQQVVVGDFDLPLSEHDLSQLAEDEKAKQVQRHFQQEASTPFDLGNDMMLRVRLLKLSENLQLILYTMHHIACDGWSMGIFKTEFSLLYDAYSKKQASPLVPLQIQYADYALWQRNWLQGEVLDKQLGYWQGCLADIPVVHSLPMDKPRPAQQTFEGRRHQQLLGKALTENIRTICRDHEVTLFMFLQTAFAVLLGRYSNETDIVMATPIAGRTHTDIEKLIGFFINTLVLRTDLSHSPGFIELLNSNKEAILDAYAYQHIPFEMLVDELQAERHLGHNPLVQILFVVQNNERGSFDLHTQNHSKESERQVLPTTKSISIKFDLELYVNELGDELSVAWAYNDSLFEEDSISRMANNFRVLLSSISESLTKEANAERRIDMLEMLTEDEKQTVLIDWNRTQTNYANNQCIHGLFEEQVMRYPEAIALVYEDQNGTPQQMSFDELNRRSNRLAHYLITQGVSKEDPVGLCIERSLDMVTGVLGVLKAGACYVPLDPAQPATRLTYLIEDSGVELILTQTALRKSLESMWIPDPSNNIGVERQIRCVSLDDGFDYGKLDFRESDGQLYRNGNPSLDLSASNLAYVIYTSGSTGQPKGVMGLHGAIVNRIKWLHRKIGIGRDDVLCQKTSIGFVDHVAEVFHGLSSGVPLVIITNRVVQSPELLAQCLNTWQITGITLVPSLLKVLLANDEIVQVPRLRTIYSSGEALALNSLVDVERCFPQARLFNLYGSTEVAADVSAYEVVERNYVAANSNESQPQAIVDNEDPVAEILPLIGKAIDNTQAYVLDKQGQPTPIGGVGELYIGGVGLSRGYLEKPGFTAERFVPHAFSVKPGACLYRTGDLVRYLSDGNLAFIGRIDHQVKIRGFRIEPGEIETVLLQHGQVEDVVVLAREDAKSEKNSESYLVAYIVRTDSIQEDGTEKIETEKETEIKNTLVARFKAHLGKTLPDYMIPAFYVFLDHLPLTTSGKVNKKELPIPEESDLQKEVYVAPRNQLEKTLCRLWQDLLKIEQVGIFDNFFALGGHSLLATRLTSAIRKELLIEIPLKVLFESPNISELSATINIYFDARERESVETKNKNRTVSDEGEI